MTLSQVLSRGIILDFFIVTRMSGRMFLFETLI